MAEKESNGKEKKRTRREKDPNRSYFGPEEEEAVRLYIQSDDPEFKARIFKDKLLYPFGKMVESLIRRYTLFTPGEEYQSTYDDAMSDIITKMDKFKPDKGKKAYSYFGTVCKRYLINKRFKMQKYESNRLSYEDYYNESHQDLRIDEDIEKREEEEFRTGLINYYVSSINEVIDPEYGDGVTPEQYKVGVALVDMFTRCEDILPNDKNNKFNKTWVISFLSDRTMLSTKAVKEAMHLFRDLYEEVRKDYVDAGGL